MFRSSWVTLAVACSFSALTFAEGNKPVSKKSNYSADELKRELDKESLGTSSQASAQREAKARAQRIRNQVMIAYDAAYKEKQDVALAEEHVLKMIEKDLKNINPVYRESVRNIAMDALDAAMAAPINNEIEFGELQRAVERTSRNSRAAILGEEGANIPSDQMHFKSVDEVMSSLVGGGESTRWTFTANNTAIIGETKREEKRVSAQVKAEFLGNGIEAGPTVEFVNETTVKTYFAAEGLTPTRIKDGRFDYFQKDRHGKDRIVNGTKVRRHMAFYCEAEMFVQAELKLGATLSLGLMGEGVGFKGGVRVEAQKNNVTRQFNVLVKTSRRIQVPETINGKMVTTTMINEICLKHFMKAKVSDTYTVESVLKEDFQYFTQDLYYTSAQTKCREDIHCADWYQNKIVSLLKPNNIARCVTEEDLDDKGQRTDVYNSCRLRGLKYQNCPVFDDKGKKTSNGMYEYPCDTGLKCVTIQQPSWNQFAQGRCMPENAKTYKNPRVKKVIEVDIISID